MGKRDFDVESRLVTSEHEADDMEVAINLFEAELLDPRGWSAVLFVASPRVIRGKATLAPTKRRRRRSSTKFGLTLDGDCHRIEELAKRAEYLGAAQEHLVSMHLDVFGDRFARVVELLEPQRDVRRRR